MNPTTPFIFYIYVALFLSLLCLSNVVTSLSNLLFPSFLFPLYILYSCFFFYICEACPRLFVFDQIFFAGLKSLLGQPDRYSWSFDLKFYVSPYYISLDSNGFYLCTITLSFVFFFFFLTLKSMEQIKKTRRH